MADHEEENAEWNRVKASGYLVEMLDDTGRWIRGTVLDRPDGNCLSVDFDCTRDPLGLVANDNLYVVNKQGKEGEVFSPGDDVHVLMHPKLKSAPLAWYAGKIVFMEQAGDDGFWEKEWALVDVVLSPGRTVRMPCSEKEMTKCLEKSLDSRKRVTEEDFVRQVIPVPNHSAWRDYCYNNRPRIADWFLCERQSLVLEVTKTDMTVLRGLTDPSLPNTVPWDEIKRSWSRKGHPLYLKLCREGAQTEFLSWRAQVENFNSRFNVKPTRSTSAIRGTWNASGRTPGNHIERLPSEMLAAVFKLLDVNEQEVISRVCTKWRNVVSLCMSEKVIIPLCWRFYRYFRFGMMESSQKCHPKMILSAGKYIRPLVKTVIVKETVLKDDDTYCRGKTIPFGLLVQYLESCRVKLGSLVLVDGWIDKDDLDDEESTKASLANVTKKLVLRNVALSRNVCEIFTRSASADICMDKIGSKALLQFPGELWPDTILWQRHSLLLSYGVRLIDL